MPHARHESARLVKGQTLLASLFVTGWGNFKVIKLRRSDLVERALQCSLVIHIGRSFVCE